MNYYNNSYTSSQKTKKRVFISFHIDDLHAKELLAAQAKSDKFDLEFINYAVNEPFDDKWKTRCRERMDQASVTICLIGEKTWSRDAVVWELETSYEYKNHLFEQYKLFIESVEKTSDRRQQTNNYFIAINTALISLVGLSLQIKIFENSSWLKILLTILGIIICFIFYFLIRSYKQFKKAAPNQMRVAFFS